MRQPTWANRKTEEAQCAKRRDSLSPPQSPTSSRSSFGCRYPNDEGKFLKPIRRPQSCHFQQNGCIRPSAKGKVTTICKNLYPSGKWKSWLLGFPSKTRRRRPFPPAAPVGRERVGGEEKWRGRVVEGRGGERRGKERRAGGEGEVEGRRELGEKE